LQAYYYATYRGRRRHILRAAAAGKAPVGVILFHRVADDNATDWTTPTADFVHGIHWLREHFELVSLAETQRRIRCRCNSRPSLSITFDDGYADNCRTALPLLIEKRIPCTYFVTASAVLEGRPFEHDLKMGNRFEPNTIEQLRQVSRAGIEIGAHGRTHADLGPAAGRARILDELLGARRELESALGQVVRYFAFPYGQYENLSIQAFHLAREAGYEGVCSAYGGWNFPGDDAFHLQRRGVDGPLLRLKNTALWDHRRRGVRRFEFADQIPPAACPAAVVLPCLGLEPSDTLTT
jgi:peptidoglycan/xylan/chitin deacetylase (PgdA/CDA1 family)